MSEFATDQEQADKVIKFVKTHGLNIATATALGLSAYFGYQFYLNQQAAANAQASNAYQTVTQKQQQITATITSGKAVAEADKTTYLASVDELVKNHGDSIYAKQALLLKAKFYASQGNVELAAKALTKAKSTFTEDEGLQNITRIRLAKALVSQKDFAGANSELDAVTAEAFALQKFELRGDILLAQNKTDAAKKEYLKAFKSLNGEQAHYGLTLKMQSLGINESN